MSVPIRIGHDPTFLEIVFIRPPSTGTTTIKSQCQHSNIVSSSYLSHFHPFSPTFSLTWLPLGSSRAVRAHHGRRNGAQQVGAPHPAALSRRRERRGGHRAAAHGGAAAAGDPSRACAERVTQSEWRTWNLEKSISIYLIYISIFLIYLYLYF